MRPGLAKVTTFGAKNYIAPPSKSDKVMWTKKTVWITGASSGIGRALAIELNGRGAFVILSSSRKEPLEALRLALPRPEMADVLPFDMAEKNDYAELAAKAIAFTGQVDVLFSNAGLSQRAEAAKTAEASDRLLMEVNYFANIALTKALLPHFNQMRSGHIAVTSSLAGKTGFFLRSGYAASKHALHGFYDSLRLEEEGNGLKVTLVCPNKVRTDISLKALDENGQPTGTQDERLKDGITPEDCAALMIKAVVRGKRELLIGADVKLSVWLKALFPGWFYRILRKQKPR